MQIALERQESMSILALLPLVQYAQANYAKIDKCMHMAGKERQERMIDLLRIVDARVSVFQFKLDVSSCVSRRSKHCVPAVSTSRMTTIASCLVTGRCTS